MRYIGGYDFMQESIGININLEMRELEYNLVYSKEKP